MTDTNIQMILETSSQSIVMAFGAKAQMIKTCEEMGELATQLCKRLNGSPTTDENIVDEIADVLIMAMQMRHVYGESKVDERILYKLDRTLNAIRKCGITLPTVELAGIARDDIQKGQVCELDIHTGAVTLKKNFIEESK